MEIYRGLRGIIFDFVCWFPGIFVFVNTLPFTQILVFTVSRPVIDDVFEDGVLCIRVRHFDVRRVVDPLVLGIVLIVFEHVGSENGVSSVAWLVGRAVSVIVDDLALDLEES